MQSTEHQKLCEFASQLSDVDLTELGRLARDIIAAQPEHERAERLNEVIDVFVRELWERLQNRLERWRSKQRQEIAERFKRNMLTETLHGLEDSDLKTYSHATRTAMLRTTDDSKKARYRSNREICLSIMRARSITRRVLRSFLGARSEHSSKGASWNKDGPPSGRV